MSYFSAGLQATLYQRLTGDAALAALVGGAIHDAPIAVAADADYVLIGEETVRANDTKTSVGALHDFTVTVHSARDGFEAAKRIAAAVCAAWWMRRWRWRRGGWWRCGSCGRARSAGRRRGSAGSRCVSARLWTRIDLIRRTDTWRRREARTC